MNNSVAVTLHNITKTFGDFTAVNNVSFDIKEGSFFSLLGPSGCGKTTLLRMIAGFESPSSGDIKFDGVSIVNVPIENRNIGMVFQNYALFPHMNVYDNIIYGLKIRKYNKDKISDIAKKYLALMGLDNLEKRMPHELSGGQQQRVALARALAVSPRLLLLDEPLSNLDAKLRDEMREELMRIKLETEITMIYVTHDQSEALYLSDYIAVMKQGLVQQLDSPENIYHYPTNAYIANFVGETNTIDIKQWNNYIENDQKISIDTNGSMYSLRPELIKLNSIETKNTISLSVTIVEKRFYGFFSKLTVIITKDIPSINIFYFSDPTKDSKSLQEGNTIKIYFDSDVLNPINQD